MNVNQKYNRNIVYCGNDLSKIMEELLDISKVVSTHIHLEMSNSDILKIKVDNYASCVETTEYNIRTTNIKQSYHMIDVGGSTLLTIETYHSSQLYMKYMVNYYYNQTDDPAVVDDIKVYNYKWTQVFGE